MLATNTAVSSLKGINYTNRGMREMLMQSNSFLMEIDLELVQMMEPADYLTLGLGTNFKFIISSTVTMRSLL